jgi:hypothetical protein
LRKLFEKPEYFKNQAAEICEILINVCFLPHKMQKAFCEPANAPPDDILGHVKAAGQCVAALKRMLSSGPPHGGAGCGDALAALETDLAALLAIVRGLVSPGKMGACHV